MVVLCIWTCQMKECWQHSAQDAVERLTAGGRGWGQSLRGRRAMTRVRTPSFLSCLHNEDIDHWAHSADSSSCLWSGNQSAPDKGLAPRNTHHTHMRAHTPGVYTVCMWQSKGQKVLQNDSTSGDESQNGNKAFKWVPNLLQGAQDVLNSKAFTIFISLINYKPLMRILLESDNTNLALKKTIMAFVALMRLHIPRLLGGGRNKILHF